MTTMPAAFRSLALFAASFCAVTLTAGLRAADLVISPNPVTDCEQGLGQATLRWSGAPGPVELRVGDPAGPSMTGPEQPPIGEAQTGYWITHGMRFFLVSSSGNVEAVVTARLRCGGSSIMEPVFRTGSYYPLQVGNTWVYRVNNRQATSAYVTRTVERTELFGGQTYFVLSDNGLDSMHLRSDDEGRVWSLKGLPDNPSEELLLDPATLPHSEFTNSLGTFPDAVTKTSVNSLIRSVQVYARGVGLARTEAWLMTGSSGGFVEGWDLVEAKLDEIRLALAVPRLTLAVESTHLNVTQQRVTNCAVPLYCVACGLIGADPPGTYKPCVQAQINASSEVLYGVELDLVNESGQVVFRTVPAQNANGELLRYVQVPLYTKPNQPLPAGMYQLQSRLRGEAEVLAFSTIILHIE